MNRVCLVVRGQVQGVGFRPFVVRSARALGLVGWVRNEPAGVRIEAQGEPARIERLAMALADAPAPIEVLSVDREDGVVGDEVSFELWPSLLDGAPRPVVPPDLATCPTCRAELADPMDRRFGYPLLSCTACGPRYTIAQELPFDRERTAMDRFPLCAACLNEYRDASDRRFHAQATVCAACGPRVRLGQLVGGAAVVAGAELLREGGILALKGLGGFQLLCDATDEGVVRRLREGKRRPDQPLAVLFPSTSDLDVDDSEASLIASAAGPIVLVEAGGLAPSVSDGLPWCGAMLPTTALHEQLVAATGRPLVCTSGNLSGEPLCREEPEVSNTLGFVDGVLDHDRPVLRAADDSVVRVVDGEALLLRRARGFAPAPIALASDGPVVLAVGAHLKNTVALAIGDQAVLSPHIGTLVGRRMLARFEDEVDGLLRIYDVQPERVVCDLHPDLPSTRFAEVLSVARGVTLVRAQHHHAHMAAVMAEFQLEGPALGFVWDGVGHGIDGTIWGAESLVFDGDGFERTPMIEAFPLPGGDRCARSPARCAIGVFAAVPGADELLDRAGQSLPRGALPVLMQGVSQGMFPMATSMGRLFDAVAFACGGPEQTTYEAAAAMWLEALAARGIAAGEDGAYGLRDVADEVLADSAAGVDPARIAARFHNGLVDALVSVARSAAIPDVTLSGGCFQNAVLLSGCRRRLEADGFRVWVPRLVPPNDGAISLGQLWLARRD
jgi:hydrogenase maturation protein HypF